MIRLVRDRGDEPLLDPGIREAMAVVAVTEDSDRGWGVTVTALGALGEFSVAGKRAPRGSRPRGAVCEDYGWQKTYDAQSRGSGVGSTPQAPNGSGGGSPCEKR